MTSSKAARNHLIRADGERGATMVEYSLMAALVAILCIATVSAVGSGVKKPLLTVRDTLGNNNYPVDPEHR